MNRKSVETDNLLTRIQQQVPNRFRVAHGKGRCSRFQPPKNSKTATATEEEDLRVHIEFRTGQESKFREAGTQV